MRTIFSVKSDTDIFKRPATPPGPGRHVLAPRDPSDPAPLPTLVTIVPTLAEPLSASEWRGLASRRRRPGPGFAAQDRSHRAPLVAPALAELSSGARSSSSSTPVAAPPPSEPLVGSRSPSSSPPRAPTRRHGPLRAASPGSPGPGAR